MCCPTAGSAPLKSLTGIRFVVALYIAVFHFGRPLFEGMPERIVTFFTAGVGIEAFFVLSGFVLAYSYEKMPRGAFQRHRFWQSRFGRIYPSYLLSLLLCAPFVVTHTTTDGLPLAVISGVASLLLVQSWHPPCTETWNFPAWSLSVEAFLYVLFPWVIVRVTRVRRVWRAVLIWVALALLPGILVLVAAGHVNGRTADAMTAYVRAFPPFFVPAFLIGVLLGLGFERDTERPRWLGGILSTAGAFGAIACIVVSDRIPPLLSSPLIVPLFGVTIYGLACGGGPIAWLLSRRVFLLLGEASYALYIFQVPVTLWVLSVNRRIVSPWVQLSPRSLAAVVLLAIVASSLVVVRWVERPARRAVRVWFEARAMERRPPAASPTPVPVRAETMRSE